MTEAWDGPSWRTATICDATWGHADVCDPCWCTEDFHMDKCSLFLLLKLWSYPWILLPCRGYVDVSGLCNHLRTCQSQLSIILLKAKNGSVVLIQGRTVLRSMALVTTHVDFLALFHCLKPRWCSWAMPQVILEQLPITSYCLGHANVWNLCYHWWPGVDQWSGCSQMAKLRSVTS